MKVLCIGSKVLGVTSKVKDFTGKVLSIQGQGRQMRYSVKWDNGASGDYFKRSLSLLTAEDNPNQPEEDYEEEDYQEDNQEGYQEEQVEPLEPASASLLFCHSQQWTLSEEVIDDTSPLCTVKAKLLFNQVEEIKVATDTMKEVDFYNLMYPMDETFGEMLLSTNLNPRRKGFAETNKNEITKFFGIRMAMILDTRRGSIANYWNENEDTESIFQAPCYGKRFKMSKNRFEVIHSCWALAMPEEANKPTKVSPTLYMVCLLFC